MPKSAPIIPKGFKRFNRETYDKSIYNKKATVFVSERGDGISVRIIFPFVGPSFTYYSSDDKMKIAERLLKLSSWIKEPIAFLWDFSK